MRKPTLKLITLFLLLFSLNFAASSQTNFENWTTLNLSGEVSDRFKVALEVEQRYNYINNHIRYFHGDLGTIFKVNDKFSIGGYYREIYEIKSGSRVIEIRPHLDFFYKFDDNWKVRIRNEYQIKEISDNIYRFRMRPTYKFDKWKNFNPLIQTEVFLADKSIVRNRLNIALSIKAGKFEIEPGYMLESNNKTNWEHIHIMWINTKIKF